MSIIFNWFKKYEIIKNDKYCYTEFSLKYLDGGSTSHSAGNISKVQELLEKYGGKRIPVICEDFIHQIDYDLKLVEPQEMSNMCQKVLETTEVDEVDMRDRIEWFKQLSDDGYYLSYDYT